MLQSILKLLCFCAVQLQHVMGCTGANCYCCFDADLSNRKNYNEVS